MKYILAFDAGTASVRAIVFDHEGKIQAVAQKEIRQIFPKPGWVEQDPQEIWFTQMSVAVEALGRARIRPDDIEGIGITNQRETTIIWDRKTGDAVYNAIVWQDRRTAEACDELRAAGHDKNINERTGLLLDSYFSGTKIAWILDNVRGVRARARAEKTDGLGAITSLALMEQGFRELRFPVVFVRAGGFYENFLYGLQAGQSGALPVFYEPTDRKSPMVACSGSGAGLPRSAPSR